MRLKEETMEIESSYCKFAVTGRPFEERAGEPADCRRAVECIATQFSCLKDEITDAITSLLGTRSGSADQCRVGCSYRSKLTLFESLVWECGHAGTWRFNIGSATLEEDFGELLANCRKVDELKSSVFQRVLCFQQYCGDSSVSSIPRTWSQLGSCLAQTQILDARYLLDIADFIMCVAEDIEQFMFYDAND
jgi:hypothetical protein